MTRYRTVIFDFDGTLANTLPLIYRAYNAVLRPRIGREIPPAELRSHFGPPDQVILGRYLAEGEDREAVFAEYLDHYRQHHETDVHLYEGIAELLRACRAAGMKVGVMTGKSRVSALISMQALLIEDLVDVLVAGDDVTDPKPHPEGILAALTALGHQPGDPGAMVGDSAADVEAGRAAGLHTIAVTWGVPEHDQLLAAKPDIVCQTVPALAEALGVKAG